MEKARKFTSGGCRADVALFINIPICICTDFKRSKDIKNKNKIRECDGKIVSKVVLGEPSERYRERVCVRENRLVIRTLKVIKLIDKYWNRFHFISFYFIAVCSNFGEKSPK